MNHTSQIKVIFDLPIRPDQIPAFKKEILHLQDPGNDVWHNHVVENEEASTESATHEPNQIMATNYFRYPLIQFRSEKINGRGYACLWGIGNGVEEINQFINRSNQFPIIFYGQKQKITVKYVREMQGIDCKILKEEPFAKYSLTHFLPFNEDRYKEYKSLTYFSEKLELIENLIANNLNLFAEQFQWKLPKSFAFKVRTLDLKGFKTAKYQPKQDTDPLTYVAVDMHVEINAEIPMDISIGNLKSLGYGILRTLKRNRDDG